MGEAQRKTWEDLLRMAESDTIVNAVLQAFRGRLSADEILLEMVSALVEDRAHRISRAVQEKLTDPPRPMRLPDGRWAFPCEACRQWTGQDERRRREEAILRGEG